MTGPKVAIVGTGMIGALHRRGAILAGATIQGVMASTPERSVAAARDWGVPDAYSSIQQVVESDVDVVHICTPNSTHVPYSLEAVARGKHVIVEKPVGVTVAEAEQLEAAASTAGVLGTVPFVYRFHPLVREIRERRLAGQFGRLTLAHGSYLQDWMLDPAADGWRVAARLGGASRAFADIGSHWCDLVEWVSGERFSEVTAATSIAVPERGGTTVTTEDIAVALLRSTDGFLGSTTISQLSAGRKNRLWFELDGMDGSAVFDQENPERVWIGGVEESRILHRDPAVGSAEQRRLSSLPPGHVQGFAQCFENFIADSYRAFAGHTVDGLPLLADGVRSARIVEAMLASRGSGRWEEIDPRIIESPSDERESRDIP